MRQSTDLNGGLLDSKDWTFDSLLFRKGISEDSISKEKKGRDSVQF